MGVSIPLHLTGAGLPSPHTGQGRGKALERINQPQPLVQHTAPAHTDSDPSLLSHLQLLSSLTIHTSQRCPALCPSYTYPLAKPPSLQPFAAQQAVKPPRSCKAECSASPASFPPKWLLRGCHFHSLSTHCHTDSQCRHCSCSLSASVFLLPCGFCDARMVAFAETLEQACLLDSRIH